MTAESSSLSRAISGLKNRLVRDETKPGVIRFGPLSGIRINLNLRNDTQIWLGLFEREIHPALRRCTRNIKSAVDVGASTGLYTLYLLMRTSATVFALEPDEAAWRELKDNVALNGFSQARLSPIRALAGRGPETFRLDSLTAQLQSPCFIKVDAEGAELEILRGAKSLLQGLDVRLLLETHSLLLEKMCAEFLTEIGYEI